MTCNQSMTLTDVVSSTLIPESLRQMCLTSLKLIENASTNQISAAMEYNKHQINILLIKLLTINFISQNRQTIKNEINHLNINNNNNDIVQLSPRPQQLNPGSMSTTQLSSLASQASNRADLEEYCEHKLLSLSPIAGFSRKNYFMECNFSNDIRIEIISYLKPIEIFKNISLINKQFNTNVKAIHQCYKHENVFCNKNFVFESFNKVQKYCEKSDNKNRNVDFKLMSGEWVYGQIDGIDTNKNIIHVSTKRGDTIIGGEVGYPCVAPGRTMSCRPGNIHKFVNVLRHGYCSETCDVNLSDCTFRTPDGRLTHIVYGFITHDFHENDDIWTCGWIDFDWTWIEAVRRNKEMFGVTYDDNFEDEMVTNNANDGKRHPSKKNEKILENSDNENDKHAKTKIKTKTVEKNKNFRIFQVRVNVDITEEYNRHDDLSQRIMSSIFLLQKTANDRCIMSLEFHIDDVDKFRYFGSKTTLYQQSEIKKYLFNNKFNNYDNGVMFNSKKKLLDAVNYPNYCVATPGGVFYAMSDNLKEREQLNKWYAISPAVREAECGNVQVSNNAVNKVYYDKQKDELWVKLLPLFSLVFEDSNAPIPLEKRYIIPCGSECRLIKARIVDAGLINKVRMEDIKNVNKKQERYFELLREWKGFIKVCIDIRNEFDQFQERLKNEYIKFRNERREKIEWDNRQYFLNGNDHEMTWLKYNKKENQITHDVFILLNSKMVYRFDSGFNFFDMVTSLCKKSDERRVFETIFAFLHVHGFDPTFALVCKDWYRFEKNLALFPSFWSP